MKRRTAAGVKLAWLARRDRKQALTRTRTSGISPPLNGLRWTMERRGPGEACAAGASVSQQAEATTVSRCAGVCRRDTADDRGWPLGLLIKEPAREVDMIHHSVDGGTSVSPKGLDRVRPLAGMETERDRRSAPAFWPWWAAAGPSLQQPDDPASHRFRASRRRKQFAASRFRSSPNAPTRQ